MSDQIPAWNGKHWSPARRVGEIESPLKMSDPKMYNFETADGTNVKLTELALERLVPGPTAGCCEGKTPCAVCNGRGLWPADLEALHKLRERQLLAQAPANADQT
jgi:hypothetical protein